ncbi:hypothetical protein BDQ17DRAFT_1374696 [Cyathus striatus]|nr:hypothetical protein BDQ17DRAFT_1374696 [Cyathus striatus]
MSVRLPLANLSKVSDLPMKICVVQLRSLNLKYANNDKYINLYRGNIIPLYTCREFLSLLFLQHRLISPQPWNTGKCLFIWIRYYGIALLIFDVTQIHLFSRPGITNDTVCVAMDAVIRIVTTINIILFLASIGGFMYILIFNAIRRHAVIADVIHLPLPGCPLRPFLWALYRTLSSTVGKWKRGSGLSLYELVLRDNILYFFGITCLLIFNNLMVVGVTKIPWFSYSSFHAAMEIMTSRMLINLYKVAHREKEVFYPGMSITTLTVFSTGITTSPLESPKSPRNTENTYHLFLWK